MLGYIRVRVQIAAVIIQGTRCSRRRDRHGVAGFRRSRLDDVNHEPWRSESRPLCLFGDLIEIFTCRTRRRRICVFANTGAGVKYHFALCYRAREGESAVANLSCEKTRYRQIPADQANEGPRVNRPFVTLWGRDVAVNYVSL